MSKMEKRCMGCMQPKEEEGVCPFCGYDSTMTVPDKNYLEPETWLKDRYTIGKMLYKNGEGAVYIAFDTEKNKPVQIHEYFPFSLAVRDQASKNITPKNGCEAQYKALMSDFIDLCNEVRRLGVCDPVIPVEHMLTEHNSVYVVYKQLDVMSLEEYVNASGGRLPAPQALGLLLPLLNMVDNIHLSGLIHRGLSPYTIFIDKEDKLYIGGFALSATRTGGSELEAELFNGFSAPEQYISTGWQGTWTDVYALGAIFYRVISGVVPPKSTQINAQRTVLPLAELVPEVPAYLSDGVNAAMQPVVNKRTQTVGAFLSDLVAEDGRERTAVFSPSKNISEEMPAEETFSVTLRNTPAQTEEISSPDEMEAFRRQLRNRPVDSSITEDWEEEEDFLEEDTIAQKKAWPWVFLILLLAVIGIVVIVAVAVNAGLSDKTEPKEQTSSTEFETSEDIVPEEDQVEVPDFVGKNWEDVDKDSSYSSLFAFTPKFETSDKYEEGIIMEQSAAKGSKIRKNSTVVLTISKGKEKLKMPDLRGQELEQAKQELGRYLEQHDSDINKVTFKIVTRYTKNTAEDHIVSTVPVSGAEFDPEKDVVELHVAALPPEVQTSSSTATESSSKPSSKSPSREESSSRTPLINNGRGNNNGDGPDGDVNDPHQLLN